MTWNGNRQAQAEADAAWRAVCAKRAAKTSLPKRWRSNLPRWLRQDGSVDYYAYIESKEWRRRKKRWFAKFGRKCGECGSETNVQLHHKTYKRLGRERDSDLEGKCGGCHCNHHEKDGKAMDPMTREFVSMFREAVQ